LLKISSNSEDHIANAESLEENLNQLSISLKNYIRKKERRLFELIPQQLDEL